MSRSLFGMFFKSDLATNSVVNKASSGSKDERDDIELKSEIDSQE